MVIRGHRVKPWRWLVLSAALLSTGCAGAIGAGAGIVMVGAGALAFTCYDRVSVTVTDRLTGAKLCDAKVVFLQGSSKTEATSCGQAALSAGEYRLRVERRGLVPFEEPVSVSKGGACGETVQSIYVALERPQAPVAPGAAPTVALPPAPPPPAAPAAPPVAPAPAAATPSAAAPAPVAPAPPAAAPAPTGAPAPSAPPAPTSPAPAKSFPPDAPKAKSDGAFPY